YTGRPILWTEMKNQQSRSLCLQSTALDVEPRLFLFPISAARIVQQLSLRHFFQMEEKAVRALPIFYHRLFVQFPADGYSFAHCIDETFSTASFVFCDRTIRSLALSRLAE